MAKTKYTHRKVSATTKDSKPVRKAVKKLPKESGRSTSKHKPPDKKPKAGGNREKPPALDQDDGANMDDPDRIFSDAEDRALDSLELTVWSDKMIANAVRAILQKDRKSTLLNIAKEFCAWIKKFIGKPSRPNAYCRWSATINRTMDAFDERKVSAAAKFVNKWAKDQAKELAATKLYEPHQAERFLLADMLELWKHWLSSDKLVRREAALYSAITFFTGARAIEVGKLHIEDLEFSQNGTAIVCPIRESKTNVFKNIPERLTVKLLNDCPINLLELFAEVIDGRKSGRLFQACKNRRTLVYHYGRGAMELGWSRSPTGHSGRTTAITMAIAAGVPREMLEITFRWASGSDMYRRYKSIHMECTEAGAPAMIARALVSSLQGGPIGTALPIERSGIKDENVDLDWYHRTVIAVREQHGAHADIGLNRAAPGHAQPQTVGVIVKTEPSPDTVAIARVEESERSLASLNEKAEALQASLAKWKPRSRAQTTRKPKKSKKTRLPIFIPAAIQTEISFLLGEDL